MIESTVDGAAKTIATSTKAKFNMVVVITTLIGGRMIVGAGSGKARIMMAGENGEVTGAMGIDGTIMTVMAMNPTEVDVASRPGLLAIPWHLADRWCIAWRCIVCDVVPLLLYDDYESDMRR